MSSAALEMRWCLQGCGIVTMTTHEEAVKAIQRLDRQQRFPGSDQPMVVKWVDQQLQKRHRQGPMGAPMAGTQLP